MRTPRNRRAVMCALGRRFRRNALISQGSSSPVSPDGRGFSAAVLAALRHLFRARGYGSVSRQERVRSWCPRSASPAGNTLKTETFYDDDSGVDRDARIDFVAPQDGTYILMVNDVTDGAVGCYRYQAHIR
jgi:hypothetical protein